MLRSNPIDYFQNPRSRRSNPAREFVFVVIDPKSRKNLASETVVAHSLDEARGPAVQRLRARGLFVTRFGQVADYGRFTVQYVMARQVGASYAGPGATPIPLGRGRVSLPMARSYEHLPPALGPIPTAEVVAILEQPPPMREEAAPFSLMVQDAPKPKKRSRKR